MPDKRFDPSRLESLLESAKLLSASLELDDMLRHLLRTVMGRMLVSRGLIALREGADMRVRVVRGVPKLPVGNTYDPDVAAEAGLEIVVPVGDDALLAMGKPLKGALEPEEQEFLQALLGLATSSISNARLHAATVESNRSLDQKIQELRALLDLGRGLAATTDADEVSRLLMLTLAGRWAVFKHAIVTWKENHPPIHRVKGLELPADVAAKVAALEAGAVDGASIGLAPGSVAFPIRSGVECSGVVVCGPRAGNKAYTEADLDFGAGLVAQAAVALENAWNFRETLTKKAIEKELEVAAGIQQDLFPKQLPALAQTELAARNRQARQVGGDYYDVLAFGTTGDHMICVADISGKGISAALLMSNIQATLRALLAHESELTTIARKANDLLWASTPPNKYATAFFLQYNAATGACQYVNGGHNDGIVLRASGDVELLGTTGLPVGLFPRRDFGAAETVLHAGDLMLLYSDGASEANDLEKNEFGMDRLTDCLKAAAALPPEQILDRIFEEIDAFAGEAPQHDDITLLVIKRVGG